MNNLSPLKVGLMFSLISTGAELVWLVVLKSTPFMDLSLISSDILHFIDWGPKHEKIIRLLPFAGEYLNMHPSSDKVADIFIELVVVFMIGIVSFFIGYIGCLMLNSISNKSMGSGSIDSK